MALFTKIVLAAFAAMALLMHVVSYGASEMRPRLRPLIRGVEAFFWTLCTAFLSTDLVRSEGERTHVALGWPFGFVTQDQSRFDPPYPWPMSWAWEVPFVPTEYGGLKFFGSWLVLLCLVYAAHWTIGRALRRAGGARS